MTSSSAEAAPALRSGTSAGGSGSSSSSQRYQHFFKDSEIVPLDPAGPPNCMRSVGPCMDINTDAMGFMGNAVLPLRGAGATRWRPYGSAGFGVIRAWTNEPGRAQNDLGFNGGGGVVYSLSKHVGLRGDLRYFRVLVDKNTRQGVLFRDYGFLRLSFGISIEFPR